MAKKNLVASNHDIKNITGANLRYINDYFSRNWKRDPVLQNISKSTSLTDDKKALHYLKGRLSKNQRNSKAYVKDALASNFMYAKFDNQYLNNIATKHPSFKTTATRLHNMMSFRAMDINPKFAAVDLHVNSQEEHDFMKNENKAVQQASNKQRLTNFEHTLTNDIAHNGQRNLTKDLYKYSPMEQQPSDLATKLHVKVFSPTNIQDADSYGKKITKRELLGRVKDITHADDPAYNVQAKTFGMTKLQQENPKYSQKYRERLWMNPNEMHDENIKDNVDVKSFQDNLTSRNGVQFLKDHPNVGTALYLKTNGNHIYSKSDINANAPLTHRRLEQYVNQESFEMDHQGMPYKDYYQMANPDYSSNKKWERKATIDDYINQRAEIDGMKSLEGTTEEKPQWEMKAGLDNLQTLYPTAHKYLQTSKGQQIYKHDTKALSKDTNRLAKRGFKVRHKVNEGLRTKTTSGKPKLWGEKQIHQYYGRKMLRAHMSNHIQKANRILQLDNMIGAVESRNAPMHVYGAAVKDGSFARSFKHLTHMRMQSPKTVKRINKQMRHNSAIDVGANKSHNMMAALSQEENSNSKTSQSHNKGVSKNQSQQKKQQQQSKMKRSKPTKHVSHQHGPSIN